MWFITPGIYKLKNIYINKVHITIIGWELSCVYYVTMSSSQFDPMTSRNVTRRKSTSIKRYVSYSSFLERNLVIMNNISVLKTQYIIHSVRFNSRLGTSIPTIGWNTTNLWTGFELVRIRGLIQKRAFLKMNLAVVWRSLTIRYNSGLSISGLELYHQNSERWR